ncbi:MAG: hypothetical protein AAGI63_10505 [Planctomycetota bacterium]
MLSWLKSMFTPPQPSGPMESLHLFPASSETISQDVVTAEMDTWRITGSEAQQTAQLFEYELPESDQCMLTYRAKIKTDEVVGKAYLEMWCRLPGRGEFFSRGLHNAVSGTNQWSTVEIPFYLKRGQTPDLLKLNVVLEGTGTVWVKEIEVLRTPLQ